MGKQHIRADTVDFQQFSRLRALRPGQCQQHMGRVYLPGAGEPRLPGSSMQKLLCLSGESKGQGELRCPRSVEELNQSSRDLRLRTQIAEQISDEARLLHERQQNVDRPHIAVPQSPGLFPGNTDQFRCQHMVTQGVPSFEGDSCLAILEIYVFFEKGNCFFVNPC